MKRFLFETKHAHQNEDLQGQREYKSFKNNLEGIKTVHIFGWNLIKNYIPTNEKYPSLKITEHGYTVIQ